MAISKIILNGVTQMDLTGDTVADASHIRSGYTGHKNDGTQVAGSYSGTSPTLTTKSITANGTYNASSDNADGYSSVTVNVSGGGSRSKSGTYTPTQTYNTSGNRAITTITNIGFTPSRFYLYPTSDSDVNGTRNAIAFSQYEEYVQGKYRRFSVYTSNTSGGRGAATAGTSWTTQTANFLYLSDGTVYIRTNSNYVILGNVEYTWVAYE